MPRPERPVDPEGGAVARFAVRLRELRRRAGSPGYRELARRVHYSATTLAQAARGESLPSLSVTLAYVRGCGGDVGEWERRWRATAAELEPDPPPDLASSGCAPYAGLAAYGPEDAAWFHGRERLVDELMTRIGAHRFVTVLGPSGTGKSSLLRAGFLPRLAAGGSTRVALFTPGAHPLEECAIHLAKFLDRNSGAIVTELAADARGLYRLVKQALVDTPSETEIVLVIDQFEEVFTLCRDVEERSQFVTALVEASRSAGSRCRVVLGVRADFYPHCLLDADLADALNGGQVAVGPMTVDELRQVIVQPALLAGCIVEGSLLATLVAHAHGRVGALPLLSHALLETWRRRSGSTLTLAGFERAGGVDGALTKTAETVFTSLTEDQQSIARRLFLRLVALGEGTPDTKCRVDREELDEDSAAILAAFSDARLVVLSEHGVEIAHEALIGAWPRLRSWLVDDRESQRIHRRLTEAATTWREHDRDPGALLRGTRLAVVTDWARHHQGAANKIETAFLDASTAADERERVAVRRRARVLSGLVALLAVLSVVTTTAAIQVVRAHEAATRQSNAAIALNAIRDADSLVGTNPALAAQISLAAYRLYPSQPTKSSLIANSAAATALPLAMDGVNVALSLDGRLAADARSYVDETELFQVDGRNVSWAATLRGGRFPARFSPDGNSVLTVDKGAVPRLWDVSDPARPTLRSTIPTMSMGGTFSPDATLLVTTDATLVRPDPAQGTPETWTEDGTTRLWNIADAGPPQWAPFPDTTATVTAFADRQRVLATVSRGGPTTPARLTLWNLKDPARPEVVNYVDMPLGVQPESATFAHDDQVLYLGDSDGTITAWRAGTASQPQRILSVDAHRDSVDELVSDPDSHLLVSGDTSGQLTVWNISTAHALDAPVRLTNHEPRIGGITLSVDNEMVSAVVLTSQGPGLFQWHLGSARSARALCRQNVEDISAKDWNKYLAGAPYQPPCA